jgi:phosphate transport system permease protein
LIFGGVIGLFAGTYLARFCPKRVNPFISQLVNLLAAIPSIVYGFFGMMIIVPILGFIRPSGEGTGLLALSIVLGLMIVPTVTALTKTSIENVDKSYYASAVALGFSHEKAVFAIEVPSANRGIMAALLLGVGRALGETLTAVMLAGNVVAYPTGFFRSVRTIPGNVALEIEGAGELQLGALIGSALVLFVLVLTVFAWYNIVKNSTKNKQGVFSGLWYNFIARFTKASKALSIVSIGVAIFVLTSIVLLLLINGISHWSIHFFTGTYTGGFDTIAPAIVSTLMYIALTAAISFPIGICTAIYLTEYTKKQSKGRIQKAIEIAIDTLSGIPSVIIGLFGVVCFVNILGIGTSILAGCLTISLMIIPLAARATQEALRSVPVSYREGAYSLGIGKARTTFKLLLPSAIPGIITMVILAAGRMLSDSAAVMFTMAGVLGPMPTGYLSEGSTLSTAIYVLGYRNGYYGEAYATASILVIMVLSLNLLSTFILNRFKKTN